MGAVPIPEAADIVLHFIEAEGGAKGFAIALHNIAKHSDTPCAVRARIYDMILTMMHRIRPEEPEELGMLTEEEIQQSLKEAVTDAAEKEEAF